MITVLIFLIALTAYYTFGIRYQCVILIVLSLYVYWQVAEWSIIIIGIIALFSLAFCKLLSKQKKKVYLILPIFCIVSSFLLLRERIIGWGLPLGFSVLSFTALSLLIDQYHYTQKYTSFEVLSYLLFFPKIFAGPIERASRFMIDTPTRFNGMEFYTGLKYLIFAAFIKFVMGDMFGKTEMSAFGINQLANVFIFAFGFFFDFWSYTLMAIGVGKLFGYTLSISFKRPYESRTLQEFWHRWNITLGTWLRDYIYIPLGGNRNSTFKWIAIVMLVFLLSGLWHGSTLPFILWGLCHGVLLCVERKIIKPERFNCFGVVVYRIVIITLVALLWQLFLIDSIKDIVPQIRSLFIYEPLATQILYQFGICLIGLFLLTSKKAIMILNGQQSNMSSIITEVSVLSLMLVSLLLLNCHISFNFFYFRF
ncbi:MAG: MBOAT family protein [Muribaculaceae bacterium]|nr:MBOAT family protein [Muribaculaceae bacterium]